MGKVPSIWAMIGSIVTTMETHEVDTNTLYRVPTLLVSGGGDWEP